ncbi:hypothetical protein MBLNU459_g2178t1 [Dothideomycetes sp. NU459]
METAAQDESNYETVGDIGFSIDSVDHGKLIGWKPSRVFKSVSKAASSTAYEYIVVTTKNMPDVCSIPDLIRPAVTPFFTTIVMIQCGICTEQPLLLAFPTNVILSGASRIRAVQLCGTHVEHSSHDDLLVGPFYNPLLPRLDQDHKARLFAFLYAASGAATCTFVHDITTERWRRLVWSASVDAHCAIMQLDPAQLRDCGYERSLVRPAMAEVVAVATEDGHPLEEDIADVMLAGAPLGSLGYRPSMLVDVDRGSTIEVEVVLGNTLQVARSLGVKTPVLDQVYRMLRIVQARVLHAKGWAG